MKKNQALADQRRRESRAINQINQSSEAIDSFFFYFEENRWAEVKAVGLSARWEGDKWGMGWEL